MKSVFSNWLIKVDVVFVWIILLLFKIISDVYVVGLDIVVPDGIEIELVATKSDIYVCLKLFAPVPICTVK